MSSSLLLMITLSFQKTCPRTSFAASFRRIFRHTALNFLVMHKALLRKFALSGEKSARKPARSEVRGQV
ncbi:MAG: hypothetical protein FWH20_09315 [Oscillospiraceae bacterium]|nr:hypothetical protein [Oscillospiraceae bacterium]